MNGYEISIKFVFDIPITFFFTWRVGPYYHFLATLHYVFNGYEISKKIKFLDIFPLNNKKLRGPLFHFLKTLEPNIPRMAI